VIAGTRSSLLPSNGDVDSLNVGFVRAMSLPSSVFVAMYCAPIAPARSACAIEKLL